MNRKPISPNGLILLFVLGTSSFGYSQTPSITWGEETKSHHIYSSSNVLGETEHGVYTSERYNVSGRSDLRTHVIRRYNKSMNIVAEYSFMPRKEKLYILSIVMMKGKITILAFHKNKAHKAPLSLKAIQLDPVSLKRIGSPKEVMKFEEGIGYAKIGASNRSPDGSKLQLRFNRYKIEDMTKSKGKYPQNFFLVVDENMKIVWKSIQEPLVEGRHFHRPKGGYLKNDGEFYYAGLVSDDRLYFKQVTILHFSNSGELVQSKDIILKRGFISEWSVSAGMDAPREHYRNNNMRFIVNQNGLFSISGLFAYSGGENGQDGIDRNNVFNRSKGYFHFNINPADLSVFNETYKEFDECILSNVEHEEGILRYYLFRTTFPGKNGGVTLVFENKEYGIAGNIIIVNLNSSGETVWTRVIPRKNNRIETGWSSFSIIKLQNKFIISTEVHEDNIGIGEGEKPKWNRVGANKSVVSTIVISPEGVTTQKVLFESNDLGTFLAGTVTLTIVKNELVFFIRRKKQSRFGRVSLDEIL